MGFILCLAWFELFPYDCVNFPFGFELIEIFLKKKCFSLLITIEVFNKIAFFLDSPAKVLIQESKYEKNSWTIFLPFAWRTATPVEDASS